VPFTRNAPSIAGNMSVKTATSWQAKEAKRYDDAYKTGQYVPTFGKWYDED